MNDVTLIRSCVKGPDVSDNSQPVAEDEFYVLSRTHIKTYSGYIGFSLLF